MIGNREELYVPKIVEWSDSNWDTFPKYSEYNDVGICGVLESEFEFSHSFFGVKYYKALVSVKRKSEARDYIPVIITKNQKEIIPSNVKGKAIFIRGQLKSNRVVSERGERILYLFIYAFYIKIDDEDEANTKMPIGLNNIYLAGYVCKEIYLRTTPLGSTISDVMLAINYKTGKSDFIPCITWETLAMKFSELKLGDSVTVTGRIQSRVYFKKADGLNREINEVSIMSCKDI